MQYAMRTTCGGYDFGRTIPENLFKIPLVLKSVIRTCRPVLVSHLCPVAFVRAFVHAFIGSGLVTYSIIDLAGLSHGSTQNGKSWSPSFCLTRY